MAPGADMGIKDFSNIAVTWLGLTAAIIGGYAAYRQYEDSVGKQLDDRSKTAIEFVTQFQSPHMLALRDKLYNFIFCGEDCAQRRPSQSEMFAFVEFFDAIKYCADRDLCDASIIKDVFGPYATWHWPCLAAEINAVRRGEAQLDLARPYGHGMETLSLKDVGSGHCGNLKPPPATGSSR
jgi:hypothetical protein